MAGSVATAGLALAAVGLVGRTLVQKLPQFAPIISARINSVNFENLAPSKYYRGGFDSCMSKREAAQILGISPLSTQKRIRDAHKKIMIANHPDKGGSPYLAMKINEAKDLLEKTVGK